MISDVLSDAVADMDSYFDNDLPIPLRDNVVAVRLAMDSLRRLLDSDGKVMPERCIATSVVDFPEALNLPDATLDRVLGLIS